MTKDSTVVYTKWFETAKTCLNKKEYTNFLLCLAEYIMYGDVPETLKGTKGYKILCTQDIPKVISKNTEKWLRKKSKMNQKQSENEPKTNEIETDSERNRNGFWCQSLDNEECELGVSVPVTDNVSVPVTDNVSVTVTEDSKESYNNNVSKEYSIQPRACETAEQSEQSLSNSLNCSSISIAEELKEAKQDFREYRKERFAKWAIILQNHNEATADENMKAYLASGAIEERFGKFKSYVPTIIEEQKAEVYEGWQKYKTSVLRKQQPQVPQGKKLSNEEKEQLSSLYRDALALFMGRGMSATEAVSKVFCLGNEIRTDAEEFVETLDIQVTPQEHTIHSPQTVSLADDAFDEDEELDERFFKWLH